MLAPAGHLQNLRSLQEALAVLHAQAVAAAQAARVEEHKRARDAEYAIMTVESQTDAGGSEAAAPKKAKPAGTATAAGAGMEVEPPEPDPPTPGAAAAAHPGRGSVWRPTSASGFSFLHYLSAAVFLNCNHSHAGSLLPV